MQLIIPGLQKGQFVRITGKTWLHLRARDRVFKEDRIIPLSLCLCGGRLGTFFVSIYNDLVGIAAGLFRIASANGTRVVLAYQANGSLQIGIGHKVVPDGCICHLSD